MLFTLQFHSPPLQLPRCWECCAQVGGKHLNIEDLKSKSVIKVVGSRPTTPPEPSLSCDGAILEQRHMSQRRTYPYSLFFKRLLGSLGACSQDCGKQEVQSTCHIPGTVLDVIHDGVVFVKCKLLYIFNPTSNQAQTRRLNLKEKTNSKFRIQTQVCVCPDNLELL